MRIMIDTNVLISAALNSDGVSWKAYRKATSYPNHGMICEQNVEELKRIFNRKFPQRRASLDKFLSVSLITLEFQRYYLPDASPARPHLTIFICPSLIV